MAARCRYVVLKDSEGDIIRSISAKCNRVGIVTVPALRFLLQRRTIEIVKRSDHAARFAALEKILLAGPIKGSSSFGEQLYF